MKIFLLALFSVVLVIEFFCSFIAWTKAKTNKEYWIRFADTVFSGGLILGFVKLVEVIA